MSESLPILYTGVYQKRDGHEGTIDFDEPGWLSNVGLHEAGVFTLQPKAGSGLPVVSVHLTPLPDGTPRELVFFSRVYGQLSVNSGMQTMLFRLYCVGWKAEIGGRKIASVNWIYPSGSLVSLAAEEAEKSLPPYVDDLMAHYASKSLPLDEALRANGVEPPQAAA